MATYLAQVQDVIQQTQPYNPNIQFYGQGLQTEQSQYDQGHAQLSSVYGSILNSAVTRADSQQTKDEFFKLVNTDIKKMAQMDLSLQSNQSQAGNVFKSIYQDKNLVKDMVWTKNFGQELERANAFKNCLDPAKCGGSYWEGGEEYLMHKRQEFANANPQDALTFESPQFVPYTNVMEKAMKAAKDAGLSVTRDQIIGNYKVTTKNGDALISPLTDLLSSLYSENPTMQKQFEIQAYNERKNWMNSQVAAGNYMSDAEAGVAYVQRHADAINAQVESMNDNVSADHESFVNEYNLLMQKRNAGKIHEGSDDHKRLMLLADPQNGLIAKSAQAKAYTDAANSAVKNTFNTKNLRLIHEGLDQARGSLYLNQEINRAAETLSHRDEETKIDADDFAKMRVQHGYDMAKLSAEHANKLSLEQFKIEHGHSSYGDTDGQAPTTAASQIGVQFDKTFKKDDQAIADVKAKVLRQLEKEKLEFKDATALDKIGSIKSSDAETVANRKQAEANNRKYLERKGDLETRYKARALDSFHGSDFYGSYTGKPSPDKQDGFQFDDGIKPRDINNDSIKIILANETDPSVKKYYQNIQEKGIKNLSPEEQKSFKEKAAVRLNRMDKKRSGFFDSGTNATKELDPARQLHNIGKVIAENKTEAAVQITKEYMKTVQPNSAEFKVVQQFIGNWIKKYGETDHQGNITYHGIEGVRQDQFNRSYQYGINVKFNSSQENINRIIKNNPQIAAALYKYKIKDKVNENSSAFFGSNDYKKLKSQYQYHEDLAEGWNNFYDNIEPKLIKTMRATLAEDFGPVNVAVYLNNGRLDISSNAINSDLKIALRSAYKDALSKHAISQQGKIKTSGLGGIYKNDLQMLYPDFQNNTSHETDEGLAENFLDVAKTNLLASDTFIKLNNVPYTKANIDKAQELISKIKNGDVDVTRISFNPIKGSLGTEGHNKQSGSVSQMVLSLSDGKTLEVNINNKIPTALYNQSRLTQKQMLLNIAGQYNYTKGSHLTNGNPINIIAGQDGSVAATGSVYRWDEQLNNGKGGGTYTDIEDLLDEYHTPESIESYIQALMKVSEKQYNTYNPKI